MINFCDAKTHPVFKTHPIYKIFTIYIHSTRARGASTVALTEGGCIMSPQHRWSIMMINFCDAKTHPVFKTHPIYKIFTIYIHSTRARGASTVALTEGGCIMSPTYLVWPGTLQSPIMCWCIIIVMLRAYRKLLEIVGAEYIIRTQKIYNPMELL